MRRETLEQLITARQNSRVLVRALDVETGEERLIDPASSSALGRAAADALRDDTSRRATVEGRIWFLTLYNTPWEIVIVGAVHIAQALAALAVPAGYRVRVIDPRAPYVTEDRFPGIQLQRTWPDEALAAQPLTHRSALVALAHDPKLDDAALAIALRSPAPYIGALGSMRTQARRLVRLGELGFSPVELAKIHGPIGLAIGARSPSEIAIAILGELVQRRRAPKTTPRVAGIVLAAGTSTRMGRNKLVVPVSGKPLVCHAVGAALAGRIDPVIVVTGHEDASVRAALNGAAVCFVHNADFAQGLSTSLRAGIRAVPAGCDGALVLLGDMPGITPELARRVVAAFNPSEGRAICVATADGQRGHPVLWGRQFFSEIEDLRGDTGARALMDRHAELVCAVEAGSAAPLIDIDTPEALESYSA
ncbi:MAG TPA: NTP transferase domain-containing protein [Rhizomicrobium sp.]|jgi:CTP:molybdopterin cytidylyltransferase MocA